MAESASAMQMTLMAESEEELKSFLIKVKEESENVGLLPVKTLGVGDGQGGLVCCVSWGRKALDH